MPTTGVAVYSTNIDGIGYRINVQGVGFLPRTITTNSTTINGAVTDTYSIGMPSIQLSLVKTAPVTGNGLLSPGLYAIGYAGGNTAQQYIQVLVGNAWVISPTCNVAPQSSNLVVDMDEVRRSWFTGVGNTQGSKAFDITVNCRVSANNQFNTVSLTMDATPDPSNAPGVLACRQRLHGCHRHRHPGTERRRPARAIRPTHGAGTDQERGLRGALHGPLLPDPAHRHDRPGQWHGHAHAQLQ